MAVTSSVWANRLRYLQPQLLLQLRGHNAFRHLESVRIVVIPERQQPKRTRAPLQLSEASASAIASAAESIHDQALSNALKRLARHTAANKPD